MGTIAALLDDGRGLVACLEPVWLAFGSLFEAYETTLGCGRPRTNFASTAAARGREAHGDPLRVACGTRERRQRFCLEIASHRPSACCPEPIAALAPQEAR